MSFGKVKNNFYPFGEFPLYGDVALETFEVLTKYANVDVNVNIRISLPGGANCVIYWGDGNETAVIGPQVNTAYNHVYASALINYTIEMSGDVDTITLFNCFTEPFSGDIANWAIFTALQQCQFYGTLIGGDLADISALTNMLNFYSNGTTTGNISSIVGWINCTSLLMFNNANYTGDARDIGALTNLIDLRIYQTNLSYSNGVLPNWDACIIRAYSLAWTATEVSDFLINLDASSIASIQTVTVAGTNAAPNAGGLAAAASLVVKGWTVIHT